MEREEERYSRKDTGLRSPGGQQRWQTVPHAGEPDKKIPPQPRDDMVNFPFVGREGCGRYPTDTEP